MVSGLLLGGIGELNKNDHPCSIGAVLEILSWEHPYDAAKDSILCKAGDMFMGPPHSHAASPHTCHQSFSKF
ncbi:unnamed protein product [Nyctereutes procyonoides]|uniref:(raccoon dog) hypothetical protein n=1 Tax=Nyctereutes procyonoides TaxID=34880 RepID=A0A811Z5P7_NYCPR|nr:unnamed protein product [Nyctereutes procyonoides]